jgi:4-amino-4-deoxy-L-arabinose transferase-like glycosyltransferase
MVEAASAPVPAPAPVKRPNLLAWPARHAYPILALLCLMLWLPGILSLPALDRDESRFAQASRQMLDSGNFIDIRFGQEARYKKPVGIYWAQAAATAVAGHIQNIEGDHSHIWTYRLPSLIGGIAATWLTCWVGASFGAEVGLMAALLMGFSVLLTAEASIAATDAVLLAAILGAQGVLMRIYRAAKEGGPVSTKMILWGWASFAIAVLLKGPVVLGVAGATIAVLLAWDYWDRRRAKPAQTPGETNDASPPEQTIFRWLKDTKPSLGLPLLLVIVAPWLIAIGLESQGAFFQQSLGHDFAAKLVSGQESHGAPPGYYILLSTIAFWPGILFLWPAIGMAVTRAQEPAIRFMLAWAVGFWLVCEIIPTKLPQYVLPAYPALAVLTALWLLSEPPKSQGWRRVLPYVSGTQFLIGLAALCAAPILLPQLYGNGLAISLIAFVVVAGLIGLGALTMAATGGRLIGLGLAFLSLFILVPTLTAGTGPRLTQFWVADKLAALIKQDSRPGDPPPAVAGYQEPSLVFALNANLKLTSGAGAAVQGANLGGLALVDDREQPAFLARLAELQSDATPLARVTGFNYSRGKNVTITLYRVRELVYARPPAHVMTR